MIFGQLRQVIASMGIEEINRDRDKFLQHMQHSLEPELAKIGLQLINVNITDITDESGYIDAIGQKAASLAIQQARGDVADNEKMGETRVAAAERDKSIQVANARKEQSIGTREAQREQAVRIATLEKEQSIGEKTAAFEKDAQVKLAEQQMRVQVAEADAGGHRRRKPGRGPRRRFAGRAGRSRRPKPTNGAKAASKQAEASVHGSPEPGHGQGRPGRGRAGRSRAAGQARSPRQGPEGPHDRRCRSGRREAPHRGQGRSRRDLSSSSKPRPAASTKSWPRRATASSRSSQACGGSTQAFQMLMLEHLDNLADASARAISNIKFDKIVVWENGGQNGRSSHGRLPQRHGQDACRR